jgi:CheY-like chemotaxis protein
MNENISILLVEDDHVDAITIIRVLKELNITNPISITRNGEEALKFLKNENNRKPHIIFLDLNMPKMNGIEFLSIMKKDENLKRIPIVVITTSKEEQDIINSFNHGVAGYMIKPVDFKQFLKVIKTIDQYWTLSELPETEV